MSIRIRLDEQFRTSIKSAFFNGLMGSGAEYRP